MFISQLIILCFSVIVVCATRPQCPVNSIKKCCTVDRFPKEPDCLHFIGFPLHLRIIITGYNNYREIYTASDEFCI